MLEIETEQQTIEQFTAEHGLTMTSEPVPENPHMSGGMVKGSKHFYCTLGGTPTKNKAGGTFTPSMKVYYSVGPGVVDSWVASLPSKVVHTTNEGFKSKRALKNPRSYEAREYLNARGKRYRPDLSDVLDCLASDASSADENFEDWAANYGYDEDSRKAENTFHVIQKQSRELRQLLGAEAYETLVYQIERL